MDRDSYRDSPAVKDGANEVTSGLSFRPPPPPPLSRRPGTSPSSLAPPIRQETIFEFLSSRLDECHIVMKTLARSHHRIDVGGEDESSVDGLITLVLCINCNLLKTKVTKKKNY